MNKYLKVLLELYPIPQERAKLSYQLNSKGQSLVKIRDKLNISSSTIRKDIKLYSEYLAFINRLKNRYQNISDPLEIKLYDVWFSVEINNILRSIKLNNTYNRILDADKITFNVFSTKSTLKDFTGFSSLYFIRCYCIGNRHLKIIKDTLEKFNLKLTPDDQFNIEENTPNPDARDQYIQVLEANIESQKNHIEALQSHIFNLIEKKQILENELKKTKERYNSQ